MKRYIFPVLALCVFILAGCARPEGSAYNYKQARVSQLTSGDTIIYSVEDTGGSMDVSLFSGPLTDAERAMYMKNGKAPSSVNVFLIKKDNRIILVDAGWGMSTQQRGRAIEELLKVGISPDMIDYVILTHMHPDHISGLLDKGLPVFLNATLLVAEPEASFWLADSTLADDSYRSSAELARAVSRAYQGRFAQFRFGQDVFPGIQALDTKGHTPGHTSFLIDTNVGEQIIIAGDFLHAAALQFPVPEESASYDMNPVEAVASRRAIMDRAAHDGAILTGMHIPYPGWGKVIKDGDGYRFLPLE